MINVTSNFFDVVEIDGQMFIKEQDITKYYPYMHGLYIYFLSFPIGLNLSVQDHIVYRLGYNLFN